MNDNDKKKLKELLLNAIAAYQHLQEAKERLESAKRAFGWAKLYDEEPRLIAVDGKLWSVKVPFPNDYGDDDGIITIKELGDFIE